MSNYVQTTFFTPKDSLPPSNPAKTIFGAAYDVEFGNISTAIASKLDGATISAGPIAFALGSAALPSVTFVGETGTGWSSDAGGDLIGSTAGVARETISGSTGLASFADGVAVIGGLGADTLAVTTSITLGANPIYAGAPQNAPGGTSYTTVLSDANKHLYFAGTVMALVLAQNSSVPYPLGTMITIVNRGSGAVTLTSSSDAILWAPTGVAGTRTIAANGGLATLIKVVNTVWMLTGSGVT